MMGGMGVLPLCGLEGSLICETPSVSSPHISHGISIIREMAQRLRVSATNEFLGG